MMRKEACSRGVVFHERPAHRVNRTRRPLGFREVTREFSFPGLSFDGSQGILFRASLP